MEEVARPPVVADEAKANDEDDDDIVMTSTTMEILPHMRSDCTTQVCRGRTHRRAFQVTPVCVSKTNQLH